MSMGWRPGAPDAREAYDEMADVIVERGYERSREPAPEVSRLVVEHSAMSSLETSPGFFPMMIIARTSSLVTSCLLTVPTSCP
jgi:hypothetical protein